MPLAAALQRRRYVINQPQTVTVRGRAGAAKGNLLRLAANWTAGAITWSPAGIDERRQCRRDHPIVPASAPVICDPRVPVFTRRHGPAPYRDEDVQQGLKQHRAREARAKAGAVEPSPRSIKVIHK